MIKVKFYEVGDAYDVEGRGPYEVIGRFVNFNDANVFSKKRGNYGTDAQIRTVEINIYENLAEQEDDKQVELVQKALCKLSDSEVKALKKHFGTG